MATPVQIILLTLFPWLWNAHWICNRRCVLQSLLLGCYAIRFWCLDHYGCSFHRCKFRWNLRSMQKLWKIIHNCYSVINNCTRDVKEDTQYDIEVWTISTWSPMLKLLIFIIISNKKNEHSKAMAASVNLKPLTTTILSQFLGSAVGKINF